MTASPAPHFNPRSPHGERQRGTVRCVLHDDFNPRSPHGERQEKGVQALPPRHFNPRSPHGERPCDAAVSLFDFSFQSTLPARGATAALRPHSLPPSISIHAPRTGSDVGRPIKPNAIIAISIHAPRTGSDAMSWTWSAATPFQSTLPARGATSQLCCRGLWLPHFNPRSPHGERPAARRSGCMCRAISIHAPRTGSDPSPSRGTTISAAFQSTLPARGATPTPGLSDVAKGHFNPRSPHGERRFFWSGRMQSWNISIHAPRTGSDVACARVRTRAVVISIHAPRTGSDD